MLSDRGSVKMCNFSSGTTQRPSPGHTWSATQRGLTEDEVKEREIKREGEGEGEGEVEGEGEGGGREGRKEGEGKGREGGREGGGRRGGGEGGRERKRRKSFLCNTLSLFLNYRYSVTLLQCTEHLK